MSENGETIPEGAFARIVALDELRQEPRPCNDMPDVFFGPGYQLDERGNAIKERTPDKEQRIARAIQVCSRCAVQQTCYDLAKARGEKYGIWGGVDFEEPQREYDAKRRAALAQKKKQA